MIAEVLDRLLWWRRKPLREEMRRREERIDSLTRRTIHLIDRYERLARQVEDLNRSLQR